MCGMAVRYIGSGPYCYASSLAVMLGPAAPGPAVAEVLTGSPSGAELAGGVTTPGSSGAPAGSRRRTGMAGDSRAGGPAASAVIRVGPEPAPTRPASTCAPAGGTGGAHPGGVSRCHVVHAQ
jgi:hypothetical protein